jgi:hypothetical protein
VVIRIRISKKDRKLNGQKKKYKSTKYIIKLFVRKDVDANKYKRLFNITLRHTFK